MTTYDIGHKRQRRDDDEGTEHLVDDGQRLVVIVGIGILHLLVVLLDMNTSINKHGNDEEGKHHLANIVDIGLQCDQSNELLTVATILILIDKMPDFIGRHQYIERPYHHTAT